MHPPPFHRAAAVALPVLLWVLAAGAGAGEPVTPAARVIYPVDYTAHKVRVFEEVEWPLIAPPPAGAPLARRYCADGQARLLLPRIEGDRLRAKLTVSASDGHQEQATPTTPQRAHILRQVLQRYPEPVPRFSSNGAELINPTELMRLRKDLAPLLGELLALQLVKNSDQQVSLNPDAVLSSGKILAPGRLSAAEGGGWGGLAGSAASLGRFGDRLHAR